MREFFRRYGLTILAAAIVAGAVVALLMGPQQIRLGRGKDRVTQEVPKVVEMYGLSFDEGTYSLVEGEIETGQTMSDIFDGFGLGPARIHRIEQVAKENTFDLRRVQVGKRYVAFLEPDSLSTDSIPHFRLAHFAYDESLTKYYVISLPSGTDSVAVRAGDRPIRTERQRAEATISSSMWNAIAGNGYPLALATRLEDIFGWSVDFFALQEGDRFEVVYDQQYVDTVRLNYIEQVWGAVFKHGGKEYYAIPFVQDGKVEYWDENGNSLKKQFLRAPLSYSRISSTFSRSRLHPVRRIYRPHHGIDYAAPTGTPAHAVADGTVTRRGWLGDGGNTVWIRHARGYETRYLHLSRYGNISVGSRVRQGQVIGYVGTTGSSTGPHLHYEIRLNGNPLNPQSIPQEPGPPIKAADREKFAVVRDKVLGELAGTLPEDQRLMRLDSIVIPDTPPAPVNPTPTEGINIIDGR